MGGHAFCLANKNVHNLHTIHAVTGNSSSSNQSVDIYGPMTNLKMVTVNISNDDMSWMYSNVQPYMKR